MKVTVLLFIVLLFAGSLSAVELQLGMGMDVGGQLALDYSIFPPHNYNNTWYVMDANPSFSPAIEVLLPYKDIMVGAGMSYQLPRSFRSDRAEPEDNYQYIPFFVSGRYRFPTASVARPELIAQTGYNAFSLKGGLVDEGEQFKGGFYYGLGFGFNYKRCFYQALYQNNHAYGTVNGDYEDAKIYNHQFNLSVNIRLKKQ